MADSLRDQLLAFGFKPAPKPERTDKPARPPGQQHAGQKPGHGGKPHADKPAGGRPQQARPGAPSRPNTPGGRPSHAPGQRPPHPQGHRPRRESGSEMDLAKAYAIRAQKEKDERIAAEKQRQEDAARRREGKAKLAELLKSASLNVADADIARHFEYGGKIRRVYVTAEQLRQVNAGELAIVQQGGRYHVVTPSHAGEAEALLPGALALLANPTVPSADDVYADPKYQVPDDLIW